MRELFVNKINRFPQSTIHAFEAFTLTAQVYFILMDLWHTDTYRRCDNRRSDSQTKQQLLVPVTSAALSLNVLQVKLGPGIWHGFGLLDGMFPRVLLSQTGQKC